MASHAKTFHVINIHNDTNQTLTCEVNQSANLKNQILRGFPGIKDQAFEIIYYPGDKTYRFRNAYGVYIGVETATAGAELIADAGLNENSKWELNLDVSGGYSMKLKGKSLYWNPTGILGTVALSATVSLWDVQESLGVPPMLPFGDN